MIRRTFLAGGASLIAAAPMGGCSAGDAAFSEREAEAAFPPVGRFVEAGGERLHYVERGRGSPVVLIHGASGNLRDWTFNIVDRLAARHRVLAFDRPGFGYSTRRTKNTGDPAVQARILAAGATALGVERPVVVGHSLGGAVAMAWALDHPAAGVVPVSAVTMPYASTLGELSRTIGLNRLLTSAYQAYVKSRYGDGIVREFVGRVFDPQPIPEGYLEHVGPALSLRETTLEANAADLNALNGALERMKPRYAGLSVPVAILHGGADGIVRPKQSRQLSDEVPDASLTVVEEIGHMAHHAATADLQAALDRITRLSG